MFKNHDKVLIHLVIISILLQSFAIIKTSDFGIPLLTGVSLILFIINFGNLRKENSFNIKKLIVILVIINVFILSSGLINQYLNIMKQLRLNMIFFIIINIYLYLEYINRAGWSGFFSSCFYKYSLALAIYGLYQIIADKFHLPKFLNIFINNPSYSDYAGESFRNFYFSYGGWVGRTRVYGTFYEPSVYSFFIILAILFVINIKGLTAKKKLIFCSINAINFYYTFSRSGYVSVAYIIIITLALIFMYNRFGQKIGDKLLFTAILVLPFVTMGAMILADIFIFNDSSSQGRSLSAFFYFKQTFVKFKSIVMGNGIGAISHNYESYYSNIKNIEPYAHNGYVQYMYEYGLIILSIFVGFIYKISKKIGNYEKSILFAITLVSVLSFEQSLDVESIASMFTVLYFYFKNDRYGLN